jgi:hypothetical protein
MVLSASWRCLKVSSPSSRSPLRENPSQTLQRRTFVPDVTKVDEQFVGGGRISGRIASHRERRQRKEDLLFIY